MNPTFRFSTIRRMPLLGGTTLTTSPRIPTLGQGSAIAELDGSQSVVRRGLRRLRKR